jgi:hypothetical protein
VRIRRRKLLQTAALVGATGAVTSLGYDPRRLPWLVAPADRLPEEFRAVPRVQNAIAVLAVAAAIAMLGLTLAMPRMSLLVTETPLAYSDAI